MNHKQNINYIPKAGLLISVVILIGLIIVGICLGNSWVCSNISILSATSSCTEAILTSSYGLVTIIVLILSGAWIAINYMAKPLKRSQIKKK